MNNITKLSWAILFSVALSLGVNAQYPSKFQLTSFTPGGPGFGTSGTTNVGAPSLPFDGGLSWVLIASGIGYCGKRFKANGNKEQVAIA